MSPEIIEARFSLTIGQLLETSEALFWDHPKWEFYRKTLLRRLNDLKRDIVEEKYNRERQGNGNDRAMVK